MDTAQSERYRGMMTNEMEAAWLYERLAASSGNVQTAETLRDLADEERQHAQHWAALLGDVSLAGRDVRPSFRTRAVAWLARVVGVSAILPRLRAEELIDIRRYEREPAAGHLVDDEREHRAVLGRLGSASMAESGEHGFASAAAASTFRAALFGFNDGLVSNLSLVAGVAGAAIDSNAVLIAGLAGWLAGAFSMASGEYVSVRSQTELFENQIAYERLELELDPEEERRELEAIYRSKGVSREAAAELAVDLMDDPDMALDTLAREELGLDPDNLGSPWRAAGGSFVAFSLGAIVPVLPFIFGAGYDALAVAIGAGMVMLLLMGMLTSLLTGRHPLFAGGRMLLIGLAATAITFGIGSVIPVDL